MFRRKKPRITVSMTGSLVSAAERVSFTPEQLRAAADRMERETEARRAKALDLALGELRAGRFAFPMKDTPIVLSHLLERIESLEAAVLAPIQPAEDEVRIGG